MFADVQIEQVRREELEILQPERLKNHKRLSSYQKRENY